MSVNSRLKATKIMGRRKALYYRQRIPESICARKETVDTDILATFRNGDRKTCPYTHVWNTVVMSGLLSRLSYKNEYVGLLVLHLLLLLNPWLIVEMWPA